MSNVNQGGPAFPIPMGGGRMYHQHAPCDGMTLRDYFAAKALQGWLSSYGPDDKHPASSGDADLVAQRAYAMADAMVAERNKGQ
jgi:hypothetical protein